MLDENGYRLIDCGNGRRLESFGGVICDRSAPMALGRKSLSREVWSSADLVYNEVDKSWLGTPPREWTVDFSGIKFSLEAASNGQVGVFPEQQYNWTWIIETIKNAGRTVKVLNVFAHTGGSSIAALLAGAEVCHVDAAKSANSRAKINAGLSGCSEKGVRWITDDAIKFMAREVKRGNMYDAVILDPPAFGRMGKTIWKFEKNMPELLKLTHKILSDNPLFFLLTSHNTGWSALIQKNFVKCNASELTNDSAIICDMKIEGEGNSLPLGASLKVVY